MADRRMTDEFAASDGKRELEIFLLPDKERKAFRRMQEEGTKALDDLRRAQDARRETDVAAARQEIAARRPAPALVPRWRPPERALSTGKLQALAESLVASRNDKEVQDMKNMQRQREDDLLARQREEKLFAEAGRFEPKERTEAAKMRRDFDHSRDRER